MVNVLSPLLFVSAYSKGHNEIDYEHGTNKELSFQFGNETQDKLIIDGLVWLGGRQILCVIIVVVIPATMVYYV